MRSKVGFVAVLV